MKKPAFFALGGLFFSILLVSCASNKAKVEAWNAGDFHEENIGSFKEFSLSNGIPVTLKNIPGEKNIELRLLFEGGASTIAKNKAGIDLLTFELLATNAALKESVSHGQYFPVNTCTNDFSVYGFSCAAANFEEYLALFASSILEPQYTHEDYLRLESAAANAALDRNENLRFALLNAVNESLYKNHPYYEGIFYKPTSRVSEYDIEQNLNSLKNAKRIKIIAAGNFSLPQDKKDKRSQQQLFDEHAAQLQEKLEELFGTIEAKDFAAPKIPAINLKDKKDAKVRFEFAGNSYCAALCFNCPPRGADDYPAFALSTLALDYVLRRDIVEKEKVAASCGVAILNGKESLALIIAAGTNDSRDIKQTISAALGTFPTEEDLLPLLDMFKNIYASKIYSSAQDEYATLEQMASSIYYEGDATAYLKRIEKIQSVSAADVIEIFKKYFLVEENFFVEVKN